MIQLFVSVAAYDAAGNLFKTKKALKEALNTDPDAVEFERLSIFDNGPRFTGATIPEGVTASVVGPDPWKLRKWYATVSVRSGKVKVA